jgi:alpha-1,3-rhamnosyl/mannosyltransferase
LTAAIAARGDVELRYFFGTHWQRRANVAPLPLESSAKRVIKTTLPLSYVVMRLAQCPVFTVGVHAFRPQVYHEPNYVAFPFRGPTVVTVHDLSFVHFPETHPADRLRYLDRYLPATLARAAHILTDSEAVRRETIAHFHLPAERVTAIYLGVDAGFAPRNETACREILARHGLHHGGYALSVGTLEPRKNLTAAIQAFHALPQRLRGQTQLAIVGQRGWLSAEVERLIQIGEKGGWLRFLGYVGQGDLPIIYAGARLFVYPSRYEGFGLPVVEAMASGVPVVTSSVSCLPEIAGNAAELVHPDDVDGLRMALQRLLEDNARHAELRVLGLERTKRFSWQRCAEETVRIYRRVTGA